MSEPVDNDSGRVEWQFRDDTGYTFSTTERRSGSGINFNDLTFEDPNEKFAPSGLVINRFVNINGSDVEIGQEEFDDDSWSEWYDRGDVYQHFPQHLYGESGGLVFEDSATAEDCRRGGLGMAGTTNGSNCFKYFFKILLSSGTPQIMGVSKPKPPNAIVIGINETSGNWYYWSPTAAAFVDSSVVADGDWHSFGSISDGAVEV